MHVLMYILKCMSNVRVQIQIKYSPDSPLFIHTRLPPSSLIPNLLPTPRFTHMQNRDLPPFHPYKDLQESVAAMRPPGAASAAAMQVRPILALI